MNKLEVNQKIASIKAKNEFWKQFNDGSYELSCSEDGLSELCKLAREMEKNVLLAVASMQNTSWLNGKQESKNEVK